MKSIINLSVATLRVLVLLVLFCGYVVRAQSAEISVAQVLDVQGRVSVISAATGTRTVARAGQRLFAGDAIVTGRDGRAAVLMADETLLQVRNSSRFALKKVAQQAGWFGVNGLIKVATEGLKSLYELSRGEIWLRNKNVNINIDIKTSTVSAAVRGTEITLRIDPQEAVTASVIEGRLLVWNKFGRVEAREGEAVITQQGKSPVKRLLANPKNAVQWTIPVPNLISSQDFMLVSNDRKRLEEIIRNTQVQIDSGNTRVEVQLKNAAARRDSGCDKATLALYRNLQQANPKSMPVRIGLGWCLLDLNKPDDALAQFAQSKHIHAVLGRGLARLNLGEASVARDELARGLANFPNNAKLKLLAALIDLLSGQPVAARDATATLLANADAAILAWRIRALAHIVLGESQDALNASGRAVELTPDAPITRLIRGFAFQSAFKLDAAEVSTHKALELKPDYLPALNNLARLQFGDGRTAQAMATIARAEQLNPADADLISLRGFIQLAQRDTQAALSSFQNALQLDPALAEPHLGLGIAKMREGYVDEALEEVTKAVALDPQRSLLLSYWGKMLYQIERFDKALDVLEHAAKLDPLDPTPEFYRAIILRDLNRPGEAIQSMNQAIRLNDSRAVYRSRFLLDRDLAVRNVDLSRLYDQLGMVAWAEKKALSAIESDYLNYAGHLFYAGALAERDDRTFAFSSEQLQARVLQPANVNTFNTFNEYTSFFERPDVGGQATLKAGNQKFYNSEVLVYGAVPEHNLAYSAGVSYETTDGWRDSNFEQIKDVAAIVKWEPTDADGIMIAASALDSRQGDGVSRRFEVDAPVELLDRSDVDLTRLELGYHHRFGPNSNLLGYAARLRPEIDQLDHTDLAPLPVEVFDDVNVARPYYQAQLQYAGKWRDHDYLIGALGYWGEFNVDRSITAGLNVAPFTAVTALAGNRLDVRFRSMYIYDKWFALPGLTLEAGVNYEHMENANGITNTKWSLHQFNPRFGAVIRPSDKDTLRVAWFRYFAPLISARLDPTTIAGLPLFRNTEEGALISEWDLTWEHEWDSALLSANVFQLHKRFIDRVAFGAGTRLRNRPGRIDGIELQLNQLLSQTVGLTGKFRHVKVRDISTPSADREEQRIEAGLKYVRPNGFSMGISQSLRLLDLKGGREDERIWLTDMEFEYELARKQGSIKLEVKNLFDRQFNWVTDTFVTDGREPEREIIGTVRFNF